MTPSNRQNEAGAKPSADSSSPATPTKNQVALGQIWELTRRDGSARKFRITAIGTRPVSGAVRAYGRWLSNNNWMTMPLVALERGVKQQGERLRLVNDSGVHAPAPKRPMRERPEPMVTVRKERLHWPRGFTRDDLETARSLSSAGVATSVIAERLGVAESFIREILRPAVRSA